MSKALSIFGDTLVHGNLCIEFLDVGDGLNGEFNPFDPKDDALLRARVTFLHQGRQHAFHGNEIRTQISARTVDSARQRLLELMADILSHPVRMVRAIRLGLPDDGTAHDLLSICDELRNIRPEWLSEVGELSKYPFIMQAIGLTAA